MRTRLALWPLVAAVVAAVVVVSTGCTALPDATPFAQSSREFAAGVKAAGRAVAEDLRSDEQLADVATQFDRQWEARANAMDAVAQYADGLVAIVRAAQDARAQAASLGDKLEVLAAAAGVVNPAAGASIAVGIDAASFIYGQIALVRGAASLHEAMHQAQPVIDRIAEIISRDSDNLREIVESAASLRRQAIATSGGAGAASFLRDIQQRREQARRNFAADPSVTHRDALLAADQLVTTARAEYDRFEAQIGRSRAMADASLELIGAMRDGLSRWTAAHRQMARALKDRQPVSVDSLADAAVEVRDLVQRLRALRDQR